MLSGGYKVSGRSFSDGDESTLKIYTLGQFSVWRKEELLSGRSDRAYRMWGLFKYLITRRDKYISSETITEILWPEQDSVEPKRALRTMVYRLRQLLGGDSEYKATNYIIHSHGAYRWNPGGDYWLDVEEFETLCQQANTLVTGEPERAIQLHKEALSLYKGDYLSEYSEWEWVVPVRNYYRGLCLETFLELAYLLKSRGQYSEIIKVCEKAFLVDFFEEKLHLCYLEALLKERRTRQARTHYEYTAAAFDRELGVQPSMNMEALFAFLQSGKSQNLTYQEDKTPRVGPTGSHQQKAGGALICNSESFAFLYELENRRAKEAGRELSWAC
jgi:two-component SAPR family response regulator